MISSKIIFLNEELKRNTYLMTEQKKCLTSKQKEKNLKATFSWEEFVTELNLIQKRTMQTQVLFVRRQAITVIAKWMQPVTMVSMLLVYDLNINKWATIACVSDL